MTNSKRDSLWFSHPKTAKFNVRWWCLIAITSGIAYFPSFFAAHYGDQLCFLAETADYSEIWPLIRDFYSYNRVRLFAPGDTLAFRPVLFTFLSIEKWLWGTDPFLWQITGYFLNLIVCWTLLRLLILINPSWTAYLMTLLFSVLTVGSPIVSNNHVNCYMISLIGLLAAAYNCYSYVLEGRKRITRIVAASFWLLIAICSNEVTGMAGICLCGFLWATYWISSESPVSSFGQFQTHAAVAHRLYSTILLLPTILYVLANYLDYQHRHPYLGQITVGTLENWRLFWFFDWQKAIYLSAFTVAYWTGSVVIPIVTGPYRVFYIFLGLTALALFAVAGFLCMRKKAEQRLNKVDPFSSNNPSCIILFFAVAMIAIALSMFCVVVLGRGIPRGLPYILGVSRWYAYMCWGVSLVAIYALLSTNRVQQFFQSADRLSKTLVMSGTIILVISNVIATNSLNSALNRDSNDSRHWVIRKVEDNKCGLDIYEFPKFPKADHAVNWYAAIPCAEGPPSIRKIREKTYSRLFTGTDLQELASRIDQECLEEQP